MEAEPSGVLGGATQDAALVTGLKTGAALIPLFGDPRPCADKIRAAGRH